MKNLFLLAVLMTALLIGLNAQNGELLIRKNNKGAYIEHTVAAKEGLYSIGRLYNVNPKFIAGFNEMDLNKGLNIGQVIHIPLSDTNYTQKSKKGAPVYYVVNDGENLMKVSNANNKVLLRDLRSWNGLTNDNPSPGTKLVVGFLTSGPVPTTTAVVKQPQPTPQKTSTDVQAAKEEKAIVKTEPATEKAVVKEKPIEDKPVVKADPPKSTTTPPVTETEQPVKTDATFAKQDVSSASPDQGYFKKSFEQQVKAYPASKNNTVTSGIFKTTSGWQDAKYYLLIDGVATGTIVRVVNPDNSKAIYAKVLGEMNGIRQNQGLDIRLSNAAASALGIADSEKFTVKLNY